MVKLTDKNLLKYMKCKNSILKRIKTNKSKEKRLCSKIEKDQKVINLLNQISFFVDGYAVNCHSYCSHPNSLEEALNYSYAQYRNCCEDRRHKWAEVHKNVRDENCYLLYVNGSVPYSFNHSSGYLFYGNRLISNRLTKEMAHKFAILWVTKEVIPTKEEIEKAEIKL